MTIPPELTQLLVSLSELTLRNTAGAISTRIQAIRTGKQQAEVVNELIDIINDLVDDRNQLIGIARGLEEALVAQRITDEEIEFITGRLIPTLEQLAASSGEAGTSAFIEPIKSVFTSETLTILQLIGFNFKAAIGEPLTQLVQRLILSRVPQADTSQSLSLVNAQRELTYLEIVKDPEAFARFQQ